MLTSYRPSVIVDTTNMDNYLITDLETYLGTVGAIYELGNFTRIYVYLHTEAFEKELAKVLVELGARSWEKCYLDYRVTEVLRNVLD